MDIQSLMLQEIADLILQRNALKAALNGIWDYAVTGASVSDVNINEQPQFIVARKLMD